jgi:hypothetical protein
VPAPYPIVGDRTSSAGEEVASHQVAKTRPQFCIYALVPRHLAATRTDIRFPAWRDGARGREPALRIKANDPRALAHAEGLAGP